MEDEGRLNYPMFMKIGSNQSTLLHSTENYTGEASRKQKQQEKGREKVVLKLEA